MNSSNDYIFEILCDCVMALVCPRGEFYPDKDYGSKIRNSHPCENGALLAYARQALSKNDGVYVKSAETANGSASFEIVVNNESRQVNITL